MSSALPLPSEETLKAIADHRQEYFKGWKLCDSTTAQSAPAAHGQALMNGAATNGCGSSASRNEAEAAQPTTSADAASGVDSSQGKCLEWLQPMSTTGALPGELCGNEEALSYAEL